MIDKKLRQKFFYEKEKEVNQEWKVVAIFIFKFFAKTYFFTKRERFNIKMEGFLRKEKIQYQKWRVTSISNKRKVKKD
jgi:hypothetical protein